MAIDAATVRKVAKLARLATPDDRLEGLAQELSGILAWIEQLNEVDTRGRRADDELRVRSVAAPGRRGH